MGTYSQWKSGLKKNEMNKYRGAIEAFRSTSNESLLENFRCIHNGKEGYGISDDQNYHNRKNLILELYQNYSPEDRPLIKWLIQEEIKGFEFDIPVQTLDLCAFMLFRQMRPEDVYELYEAKFGAGSDAQGHIDIELVFGFGQEETKAFLRNEKAQKELNAEILETIAWYESNPNAKFKSREAYIQYFETRKAPNNLSDLEDI